MSVIDKGAVQSVDTAGDRLDKGAVEFASAVDTTPPTIESASIASDGNSISIVLDEAVDNFTGFSISATGGASSLTYSSGDGTDTLVFTLSRQINNAETITLAYVPGDVADLSGNALEAASDVSVTNGSTVDITNPTISSRSINTAGTQLSVVFSEAVTGSTGITLASAGKAAVTASYASGSGSTTLVFTLSRTVFQSETVTLSYSPGNIEDGSGNALQAVSGQAVTNNSTVQAAWTMSVRKDGVEIDVIESVNVAGLTYTIDPVDAGDTGSYTAVVTRVSSGRNQTSNAVSVTVS